MKDNEILEELYRQRAEHAHRCNYDVREIFRELREGTERRRAEGWRVVSLEPCRAAETASVLRDEPPKQP